LSLFLVQFIMKPKAEQRPVDLIFEDYNRVYKLSAQPFLVFASIILMIFGLFALIWALPFPHLGFLGRYNGYLNWASFLIAVMIYYYLKLSPMVSYLILFLLFGMSFGVIRLEQWQKAGGPNLWLIGLLLLSVGLTGQIYLFKKAKMDNYLSMLVKSLSWLIVKALKSLGLKY
jgi:hypothetical protein